MYLFTHFNNKKCSFSCHKFISEMLISYSYIIALFVTSLRKRQLQFIYTKNNNGSYPSKLCI